jgi:hypothetical protein
MSVFRVAIVEQIATVAKGAQSLHGHVPGHLLHPSLVGLAGYPFDVDLAALQMDEKQHIISHQPAQREDLDRKRSPFPPARPGGLE